MIYIIAREDSEAPNATYDFRSGDINYPTPMQSRPTSPCNINEFYRLQLLPSPIIAFPQKHANSMSNYFTLLSHNHLFEVSIVQPTTTMYLVIHPSNE